MDALAPKASRLLANFNMIEKKAEGEVIESQPASTNDGKVLDLMAALEASLTQIRGKE